MIYSNILRHAGDKEFNICNTDNDHKDHSRACAAHTTSNGAAYNK